MKADFRELHLIGTIFGHRDHSSFDKQVIEFIKVDLIEKGITGKDADAALGRANITVNKNSVPNDPQSPFVTSGIRVGTPAMTTRGFNEQDATDLATWMCDIIDSIENDAADTAIIDSVREKVGAICARLPVYEK